MTDRDARRKIVAAMFRAGLSVVPGYVDKNGAKRPALKEWKQYQRRRPSLSQVKAWAAEVDEGKRADEWGYIAGQVSGRFCLDFDGPEGERTMRSLGLKPHRRSINGGYHVDVALPPGERLATVARFAEHAFPGLDCKAEGGYVAVIANGRKTKLPTETLNWEDLPSELRDVLPRLGEPSGNGHVAIGADDWIAQGNRNAALFDIARSIRFRTLTEDGARAARRAALQAINAELCNPPLDLAEICATADSAGKYPVPDDWPQPMGEAAYYGIAGEVVRTVAPETEADPNALLITFLVGAGNALDRNVGARVGPTEHPCNLFAVIVGETGSGRKGTAWDAGIWTVRLADHEWAKCIHGGLTSGEGLIYHVRDEVWKPKKKKKDDKDKATEDDDEFEVVCVDRGAEDKRLMVYQSEFAQPLAVMKREGNTLSSTLREAWDAKHVLNTLAKQAPVTATNAHVSVLANITATELKAALTTTDAASGFGNRILWVCAKRSQVLPDGGNLTEEMLAPFAARLRRALQRAQGPSFCAVTRDAAAAKLWRREFGRLTAERSGLVGAMTGRAEAQVLRLSVLYALLDEAAYVGVDHLRAALEVWRYCEESAAYLFGRASGDPDDDKLMLALAVAGDHGMTTTEVQDKVFAKHNRAGVTARLKRLEKARLLRSREIGTGGRPTRRWWIR